MSNIDISKAPISKIFFSVLLCFCLLNNQIIAFKTKDIIESPEFDKEMLTRMKYYQNFADKNKMGLTVGVEDNKFTLKQKNDVTYFSMNNYMILNSCEYFPYFEDLYQIFSKLEAELSSELFMHSVFLTFKIMYYIHGDHKTAENYFQESKHVIVYYPHPELQEYLNHFPKYNERNIFSLDQEDLKLAKRLNINIQFVDIYSRIFKSMVEKAKDLSDKFKSVNLFYKIYL